MAIQGFYKRSDKFVAVKHIRLTTAVTLEPGSSVDDLPGFQKQSLFRRRLIGVAGSDWVKEMLAFGANGLRKLRPEISKIAEVIPEQKKAGKKAGKVVEQVVEQAAPAIPPNVSSE